MTNRKKISFKAVKTVKKPTKINFVTKSGERISFNATKTVKKVVPVEFYVKPKRRKK